MRHELTRALKSFRGKVPAHKLEEIAAKAEKAENPANYAIVAAKNFCLDASRRRRRIVRDAQARAVLRAYIEINEVLLEDVREAVSNLVPTSHKRDYSRDVRATLLRLDGMSHDDIAELVGITPDVSRQTWTRTLRKAGFEEEASTLLTTRLNLIHAKQRLEGPRISNPLPAYAL